MIITFKEFKPIVLLFWMDIIHIHLLQLLPHPDSLNIFAEIQFLQAYNSFSALLRFPNFSLTNDNEIHNILLIAALELYSFGCYY